MDDDAVTKTDSGSSTTTSGRRGGHQVAVIIASAAVGLSLLFVVLPTLFTWATGRFEDRQVLASTSPDRQYRITGIERADFPANEILDPSATLRIDVTDSAGHVLDQYFIGQYEYGDFSDNATVVWEPDGRVRVLDIDRTGHGLSVVLDVHAFERPPRE